MKKISVVVLAVFLMSSYTFVESSSFGPDIKTTADIRIATKKELANIYEKWTTLKELINNPKPKEFETNEELERRKEQAIKTLEELKHQVYKITLRHISKREYWLDEPIFTFELGEYNMAGKGFQIEPSDEKGDSYWRMSSEEFRKVFEGKFYFFWKNKTSYHLNPWETSDFKSWYVHDSYCVVFQNLPFKYVPHENNPSMEIPIIEVPIEKAKAVRKNDSKLKLDFVFKITDCFEIGRSWSDNKYIGELKIETGTNEHHYSIISAELLSGELKLDKEILWKCSSDVQ